jgi:hypothetical protein
MVAARYLEALEQGDFDAMAAVWKMAQEDPELEAVLHEVHEGLLEEQTSEARAVAEARLTAAVEAHLPSAEIVRPTPRLVTVGDVAGELYRHAPGRLPAVAHQLNERLRASDEPLPADLGLSQLTSWAETRFGSAPPEYWRAFRQAAVKLELRRAAEAEYQLAARPITRPEDK